MGADLLKTVAKLWVSSRNSHLRPRGQSRHVGTLGFNFLMTATEYFSSKDLG